MAQEIAVQILPPISGYPMSLNTQMKAFKCLRGECPVQVLAASQRAEMALRQTHILEGALKAGEPMRGSSAPWSGRSELLSRQLVGLLRDGVRGAGPEQWALFAASEVPAHRCLIGHCCDNEDPAYHRHIVASGSHIGVDRTGYEDI